MPRRRRVRHHDDHDPMQDVGVAVQDRDTAEQDQAAPQHAMLTYQQTLGNRAVQRMIQRATPEAATGYMGMNPQAHKEADSLGKSAAGKIMISLDSPEAERGLKTPEGCAKFVFGLGIHPFFEFGRFMSVYQCLLNADVSFRDQMGDMIKMFLGAERGDYTLERLILSGHSNGVVLWGDAEGKHNPGEFLPSRDLVSLTRTFPNAAGQVQDVMFSACFSVGIIDLLQAVFPNMQTAWLYAEFSPSIKTGSISHMKTWERNTRADEQLEKRDSRGSSALWTRDKGFISNDPASASIDVLVGSINAMTEQVKKQVEGDDPIDKNFLASYYIALQRLLNHPEADDEMKKAIERLRDKTLRMRYWDKVCERFQSEYAPLITVAYAQLETPAPKFAGMTRKAVYEHIDDYKKALEKAQQKAALEGKTVQEAVDFLATHLELGLQGLDPKIIPTQWI